MPRKPKIRKSQIVVAVNGVPIAVTMFPPQGKRRSWYAYWKGLRTRKSTGRARYEDAVVAVNDMLNHGGDLRNLNDAILSDEEFDEIQRRHYSKRSTPETKERGRKSLDACMNALSAFRAITGLKPITSATADDCEKFQHAAQALPKNWRAKYPKSKTEVAELSANTIVKWSVALQAAFERASENAGRKCVRGIVPSHKLLKSNPWRQFTWIEAFDKRIRHYDGNELISLLDHFRENWAGVSLAETLLKLFVWSWGRRNEVTSLKWSDARTVGTEHHFESVGKWGVEKWFRVPQGVYEELLANRTESPYLFAKFNEQLRRFHEASSTPWHALRVRPTFDPENLGDWLYNQIVAWSKESPKGTACLHMFRKTSLQYARAGEDMNRLVARDARVGESVMMTSYVKETDEEFRQRSNRTFHRISLSLPPEVARRFGSTAATIDPLQKQLADATAAGEYEEVARIATELARRGQRAS